MEIFYPGFSPISAWSETRQLQKKDPAFSNRALQLITFTLWYQVQTQTYLYRCRSSEPTAGNLIGFLTVQKSIDSADLGILKSCQPFKGWQLFRIKSAVQKNGAYN